MVAGCGGVAVAFAAWCILLQQGSPFPQRGLHRTMGQMKNRMLKLLLLLAAVAALAVAAPLAAPDFNDLDDSDLDDSDLDDSDNDASDLDGTDADNLLQQQEWSEMTKTFELMKAEECYKSQLTCQVNEFIDVSFDAKARCAQCPEGRTQPYGNFKACGSGMCSSCPFTLDSSAKICVTQYQENLLKRKCPMATNCTVEVSRSVDQSRTTPVEARQKNEQRRFFLQPYEQIIFALQPLPVALQVDLQATSCATGLTCCLPGFYGASSSSCTECPSNKPSSPFSAPNSNCQCPNSASNKCFACNNLCRPYDSVSRMCVPVSCPSGQTCKVQSGAATCV
jgi:hypothetical protein